MLESQISYQEQRNCTIERRFLRTFLSITLPVFLSFSAYATALLHTKKNACKESKFAATSTHLIHMLVI